MTADFLARPEVAPFWFRRGPVGCLLIHGYTDSPGTMRHLGGRLAQAGFTVRCDLLPGHGGDPLDLNMLTWKDWWTAVLDSYDSLARDCTSVVVAGLSFGGTLALHLATHRPVAGVVTLAGMLELADPRVHWSRWLRFIVPQVAKSTGPDVRRPATKDPYPGYMVIPLGGLWETLSLAAHVVGDMSQVRCPLLAIHGRHDATVPLVSSRRILDESGSLDREMIILEESAHVVTLDSDREFLADSVIAFTRRVSGPGSARPS